MSASRATGVVLWSAALVVAATGSAMAATFSITTPGNNNTTAVGQNFSPSVGGAPNPGLAATDPVSLSSFSFRKGSAATGNASTRLAVLPGAYYDTNGSDGTFQPTVANLTAISTNTLDTAGAADGVNLTFNFAGATLQYGSDYTVAFVTVGAGDVLNFIPVSVKYVDYIESPVGSGTYVPSANYGGTGNYNATTLYPDFNGDGYFEADSNAADIAFVATFQTVPEPTTLASVGVLATLTRRRRRAHR